MRYLHRDCNGEIRFCPVNEMEFCDKCDQIIREEQEITTIHPEPQPEDFQLTNCNDRFCSICVD